MTVGQDENTPTVVVHGGGKDMKTSVRDQMSVGKLSDLDATVQAHEDEIVVSGAVLVPLSAVKPERIEWMWLDHFAFGKLAGLLGDPGTGKSTFALDLAARLTTGRQWPDGAPGGAPSNVLFLGAEDGLADTVRPRFDAAGGNPARFFTLVEVPVYDEETQERKMVPPSLPRDIPLLGSIIREKHVRLVIIDVLMAFLAGRTDSNSDQDMRARVLHPLGKMAEATGCAVLALRHMNKSQGSSPVYRGGGSIGITGAFRSEFLIAADPNDPSRRIFAVSKMNIGQEPQSLAYRLIAAPESGDVARVEWEDTPVALTARDLLGEDDNRTTSEQLSEAADWLLDFLTEHEGCAQAKTIKKAAKDADISERTLQRARAKLGLGYGRRRAAGGTTLWWTAEAEPTEGGPIKIVCRATSRTTHATGPDLSETVAQHPDRGTTLPVSRSEAGTTPPVRGRMGVVPRLREVSPVSKDNSATRGLSRGIADTR
jgi:hypothetical protein